MSPTFDSNRRDFLKTLGLGGLALSMPQILSAAEKPTNVILILADDLGYECLECNGGTSYKTPNLNEMARTGARFEHCYATPLCSPTRLNLMTGKQSFRTWMAFGLLDPDVKTFGHYFSDNGYSTCISGKWQLYSYNAVDNEPEWRGLGMRPEDSGFDEYCVWHADNTEDKGSRYPDPVIKQNGVYLTGTEGKYGPDMFADYIIDFIERKKDSPFFVYYPMALTHYPFNPTPHSESWETGDHFEDNTRNFPDMVEYMDFTIGRILDRLDELGLDENTLVLFLGDNGTDSRITSQMGDLRVRGGKGMMTDAGTHVPMLARWKGVIPEGTVCDDPVDTCDFLPTMAEASGISLPENEIIDGRSFLQQLRGEPGDPRGWVFVHHYPLPSVGAGVQPYTQSARQINNAYSRFARDKRYKLYHDGRLFDIANDPLEQKPIWVHFDTAEERAARKKLQEVLDYMYMETINARQW